MKKFLIAVAAISLISTCYVFQQTMLLENSYAYNKYSKSLALLVDQNSYLRYNITRLETPARLENLMLAKNKESVCMPRTWYRISSEKRQQPAQALDISPARTFFNTGRMVFSKFLLDNEAIAKDSAE